MPEPRSVIRRLQRGELTDKSERLTLTKIPEIRRPGRGRFTLAKKLNLEITHSAA
jgi:hypothetical protein